ncbi:MAG TPA: SDR family oxidoreductase, partial [Thermodesulfobacteriota bacterium]|nr:SDR family oxidoreductase [Thermodesulfobacteriota bacterium]
SRSRAGMRRKAIRTDSEAISERRRHRTSTFLMTGGTGFLGSHIAAAMLRRGFRIILLARPSHQQSAEERVADLFRWLGLDSPPPEQMWVIEARLDQPDFGLKKDLYEALRDETDEIIHCASNTSFSERKRKEMEATNLGSLRRLLDFAAQSRCCFFHHMSTAYVAGRKEGTCPEEAVFSESFNNVYEESKYHGERMISGVCQEQGIRLNIYRPSIVYGDSRTGKTLRFNALYYPVRTVLFFKNLFEKDLRERDGKRAAAMGVRIDEHGVMHLPIRVEAEEQAGINLIPIDYLVDAFLEIMETCLEGGLFHIVNRRLVGLRELADYTRRFFNLEGIEVVPPGSLDGVPKNGLEVLFDGYLEAYQPYMTDTRRFENEKARKILAPKHIECPDFDFDLFSVCMRYGEKSGWGAEHPKVSRG